MKIKRLLPIAGMVLLGVAAIVTSCEKESDYNFNKIEPGRTSITGEDISTGIPYIFKALTRGGSTYDWEIISGDFEITPDGYSVKVVSFSNTDQEGQIKCTETTMGGIPGIADTFTFSINVLRTIVTAPEQIFTGAETKFVALKRRNSGSTFTWKKISGDFDYTLNNVGDTCIITSDADTDGVGVIVCTETTALDVVGIPDTVTFDIFKFCEFDINIFTGEYTCDEEGYGAYGVNLTQVEGENAVLNDNFWDWAASGQVIRYEFSGDYNQIVTVPLQDFIFGDDSQGTVEGSGTYNSCTGVMDVNYIVVYGGEENETHHVFTPGAPVGKSALAIKKGN